MEQEGKPQQAAEAGEKRKGAWPVAAMLSTLTAVLGYIGFVTGRAYTWSYLESAGVANQVFTFSTQDLIFLGYTSQAVKLGLGVLLIVGVFFAYAAFFACVDWLGPWLKAVFTHDIVRRVGAKARVSAGKELAPPRVSSSNRFAAWWTVRREAMQEIRARNKEAVPLWLICIAAAGSLFVLAAGLGLPSSLLVSSAAREGRQRFNAELAAFNANSVAQMQQLMVRPVVIEQKGESSSRVITGFVVQATAELVAVHDGRALELVVLDDRVLCYRTFAAGQRPELRNSRNCGADALATAGK